mgnify:FL=1
MIKRIATALTLAAAAFIVGAMFLPETAYVQRSIDIARPAGTVFTVLNRFEALPAWSPWSSRDPNVEYRFSGPREGVGARLHWSGDPRQVGSGWMEITESLPNSRISSRLFLDHQGEADTTFLIERIAGGSRLTWILEADLLAGQGFFGGVLSRYFGLFFDRWIGADFSTGLSRFRDYVESLPSADFSGLEVDLVEVIPGDMLYVSGSARSGGEELARALADAFREISSFMAAHDIELAAQPMTITRSWDAAEVRFEAAIPAARRDLPATGNVRWGRSPGGLAARVVHHGPYEGMAASYAKLAAWMAAHGLREGRVSWEHYISDPGETPDQDLITHIYFQIADDP